MSTRFQKGMVIPAADDHEMYEEKEARLLAGCTLT
jgi:hypothetical protein